MCINPDETCWFLCGDDFNGSSDSAYCWNEIESQSIEIAEGYPEWKAEIKEFWDKHLPIMLSVKSGYAYFAVNLFDNFGAVVYGIEPEYEETEKIANSFDDFLLRILTKEDDALLSMLI